MATMIPLAAQPRDATKTPRMLRREQVVPGVIYGHGTPAMSLQFEYQSLMRAVRQAGTSHLIALSIAGDEASRNVLVREVQRDPVTSRLLHIDLFAIVAGEKLRITVPVVQRGEAPAAKLGGSVMQMLDAIEVECLPENMPELFEVDLSRLETLHSRLTVADLHLPDTVTVLTPMDAEVVGVTIVRVKAEEEVAAPAEAEGAAAATDEAKKEPAGTGPSPR
jgi:large subunit ribosomal protein L25